MTIETTQEGALAPETPITETQTPADAGGAAEGGGEATPAAPEAPAPEEGRLTVDNFAERLAKYKKPAKTPSPGEQPRGDDGKFKPKEGEGDPAPAAKPKAGNPAPGTPAPAAGDTGWKPKDKYLFQSLGKEYELPKFAKDAIKNADDEKAFIDVYEKAMGLDHVKQRHQELHGRYVELENDYEELSGGVGELKQLYANAIQGGNILLLDDFFAKLKIPANVILQYAAARIEYEEADQHQRQVLDGQIRAQRHARDAGKQATSAATRAQSSEAKALALELNASLARPDVASLAHVFDGQPGRKPGDFKTRVIEHGEYVFLKSQGKTMLSPEEAVQQVIAMYGLGSTAPAPAPQGGTPAPTPAAPAPAPQGGAPAATPAAPAPAAPAPQGGVPVIPVAQHRNVPVLPATGAGGTVSPAKKKPMSIDEIRKIAKEKANG